GNIQPIGSTQPVDPAKSDCDTTKPGGQLIFGGESHVYAADGSLEVCGGPNPDDPDGSLVIGVYGVPAVETRQPTAVAIGAPNDDNTRLDDPAKAKVIGEASGRADLNITYDNDFFGTAEANVDLTFPSIGSLPNGYRIGKVSARYSYDSNNP